MVSTRRMSSSRATSAAGTSPPRVTAMMPFQGPFLWSCSERKRASRCSSTQKMMISSSYGTRAMPDSNETATQGQTTFLFGILPIGLAPEGPSGEARLDHRGGGVQHNAQHGEHQQPGEHDRHLER